jgi:hypothetical protein
VPFSADEVQTISQALIGALTGNGYRPEASRRRHRAVNGWNVQIQREHIAASRLPCWTRMGSILRRGPARSEPCSGSDKTGLRRDIAPLAFVA